MHASLRWRLGATSLSRGTVSNVGVIGGILLMGLVLAALIVEIRKIHLKDELEAQQKAQREGADKLAEQRRINVLAAKWDAVSKWHEEFSGQDSFLFTAVVTRVLVRSDGRPLLFKDADAEDVVERAGQYTCYFRVPLNTGGLLPLLNTTARLALSCDSAAAEALMRRGQGENYAVVARISGVQSYEDVNTQSASGETLTERRFLVSGTELGQEEDGADEVNSLNELLLKSLGSRP